LQEVANLTDLCFGLFRNSQSPLCFVTLRPIEPDNEPLAYVCPKSIDTHENDFSVLIEPYDVHFIYPHEARSDPLVWPVLMWGGRRDLSFMRRLQQSPSLEKLEQSKQIVSCEGVIRGNRKKRYPDWVGRRLLEQDSFPANTFLHLDAKRISRNLDPNFERPRSTRPQAFDAPQLLIKQGWQEETGHFQAALVNPTSDREGVLCSQSYISVSAPGFEEHLEAACLSYNSSLAGYYVFLTSGRFSSYRMEALKSQMMTVPIPPLQPNLLKGISNQEQIERRIRRAFDFKDAEWVLIEDMIRYTLPFAMSDPQQSSTPQRADETQLRRYCQHFQRVITAGFGEDKAAGATIFQNPRDSRLPIRLVSLHFNATRQNISTHPSISGDGNDRSVVRPEIKIEEIDSPDLLSLLHNLHADFMTPQTSGFSYQRMVRAQERQNGTWTVHIVKPDIDRFWTRSIALRDADGLAADILRSSNSSTNSARKQSRQANRSSKKRKAVD
jgi:hypothetical protein